MHNLNSDIFFTEDFFRGYDIKSGFFFKSFTYDDYEDLILSCRNLEELGLLYLAFDKDGVFSKHCHTTAAKAMQYFFNEVATKLKKYT